MATIKQIREAIAARVATITGLHTHATVPDSVEVPAAVVYGPEIDFDSTMARGSDDYRFWLIVFTSRANELAGQDELDTFLAPSGETSIKAAVEGAGGDLGGVVDFVRVKSVREYGDRDVNGIPYFCAAIEIEVTARP